MTRTKDGTAGTHDHDDRDDAARAVGGQAPAEAAVADEADGPPCHPLAEFFPPTGEADFEALKEHIRAHGLRDPVWLFEGQIVDGRSRHRACRELGVRPAYQEWDGRDSLLAFVAGLNLARRHLSESQRAMLAAQIKTLLEQEAREQAQAGKAAGLGADLPRGRARDRAAAAMNVSSRSVGSGDKVLREGTPELVQAVQSGQVSVSAAADLAGLPAAEQAEALGGGPKAAALKAKEVRRARAKKRPPAPPTTGPAAAGAPAKRPGWRDDLLRAGTLLDDLAAAARRLADVEAADRAPAALASLAGEVRSAADRLDEISGAARAAGQVVRGPVKAVRPSSAAVKDVVGTTDNSGPAQAGARRRGRKGGARDDAGDV